MDEVRAAVVRGSESVPHGGMEVGGVLFGTRRDSGVAIAAWRPIHCEHAYGPTFRLSHSDLEALDKLLTSAKSDPDLATLQPVGWFRSRTRSEIKVGHEDLEISSRYFREPWQVTLVLKPVRFEPTVGRFYLRRPENGFAADELDPPVSLAPVRLRQALATPENGHAGAAAAPARAPEPLPEGAPVPQMARGLEEPEPVAPRPLVVAPPVEPPRFLVESQTPARRIRWGIVLAVLLAVAACGAATYFIRDSLQHRGSLGLQVRAAGTGLGLTWDRSFPLLGEADAGVVEIADVGDRTRPPDTVQLTREELRAGSLTWGKTGSDVKFTFVLLRRGEPLLREYTRYIGTQAPPAAALQP